MNNNVRIEHYNNMEHFRLNFMKMNNNDKSSIACALFKRILLNPDSYIKPEDTFANWYKNKYEFTGDKYDVLKVKDMFDFYSRSDAFYFLNKEDRPNLTKFLLHFVYNDNNLISIYKADYRSIINGEQKKIRRVFIGMRLKHIEDDSLDN